MRKEYENLPDYSPDASTLFVLGAMDPEMQEIVRILQEQGSIYVFAQKDGEPVRPNNAYQADEFKAPLGTERVVFVECQAPFETSDPEVVEVVVIDHHRPGDPGYDEPDVFWASSLGQLYRFLELPDPEIGSESYLIGVCDHNLKYAYRRWPADTLRLRAKQKASFLCCSEEGVLNDFRRAINALRRIASSYPPATDVSGSGKSPIDLREGRDINFANEASAYLGVPIVYGPSELPDGRKKYGLLGASPSQVQAWLDGEGFAGKLQDRYGVPSRGIAGGYIIR
jgi:hypothetical protein